jgi:dTDP-4-dehydrorhamnose 3,5-epimerase
LQKTETPLNDVVVLEPKVFGDARGFFFEAYNEARFHQLGLPARFVQDNQSGSRKGVLRGLHYQMKQPQGKLVRALRGEIFDVAVDVRRDSPQFGQWFGLVLNEDNRKMLWIPAGFAHGFLVMSEFAEVAYKASDFYAPEHERSLLWNDPAIGIEWPLDGAPTLSAKDAAGVPLAQAETYANSTVG